MKYNLLLPLAVLCFAALGCSAIRDLATKGKDSTASNSKSGSSSKGSTTFGADPKEEIVAASKKFIELPGFSAKMEGNGASQLRMQVDYAAPDSYHIMYLGGTGAGMEMIMIGNKSFIKTGGKWSKMPGDGNASIPTLRDSFTEEGLKTLTDVKYDGDDTIDGNPAAVYSYKNVTPKGGYPFTSKIWVSKDTGLPMKITVDYTNGTLKQMTVVYDTETPVTIEAPIS
jgi:outer membrane lipoprotein-sorting protein